MYLIFYIYRCITHDTTTLAIWTEKCCTKAIEWSIYIWYIECRYHRICVCHLQYVLLATMGDMVWYQVKSTYGIQIPHFLLISLDVQHIGLIVTDILYEAHWRLSRPFWALIINSAISCNLYSLISSYNNTAKVLLYDSCNRNVSFEAEHAMLLCSFKINCEM